MAKAAAAKTKAKAKVVTKANLKTKAKASGVAKTKSKQVTKANRTAGSSAISSKLFQKGRIARDVVRKATSMTKEQWLKHQVGMNAKWPFPDYMKGVKSGMNFREDTYAIVTRWTANTKIQYRPHAKSPGSKSHLRYEKYSKAKTVAEALQLSSYPIDWCWDYERGFIKVVGGEIRDEPLDMAKVEDPKKLTKVDMVIHTWYKRELAKQLGIPVKELTENQGWGESLVMRAQRRLAQKEAKERLEAAEKEGRIITDEDVYLTLKRWPFFRNPWRQNVMPEGMDHVFSDTLGLLRDRSGDIHLTAPTRRYPQVAELLARWLTDRLPEDCKSFRFTSMNLNCNYAARMHRDAGNMGPSFIKAFGPFTGGELNYWPEDAGGKLESVPDKQKVQFNIKDGLALFNGNCAHSVEDFAGTRYSIVYFTIGCHAQATPADKEKLRCLGLPYPAPDQNPHELLRSPRGYDKAAAPTAARGKKVLLPSRYWGAKDLEALKSRCKAKSPAEVRKAAEAARKRRVSPEDAYSFLTANGKRLRGGHAAGTAK